MHLKFLLMVVAKGSFEDFIYILAGLVWVAFSIYKGSQKQKKAKAAEGTENKESKSTIEDIIGEFLGVKKDETVYQDEDVDSVTEEVSFDEVKEIEPQKKPYPSNVFSYDDKNEEGNFSEEKAVYASKVTEVRKVRANKGKKPIRKGKKPRFDVRKAVIYSEILKRPVY